MIRTLMIAASIALPTAPALAQGVLATHTEIGAPAGRSPHKLYAPIARANRCDAVQRHHHSGKLPMAAVPAADRDGCTTQVAARETEEKRD